jgi:DNA polymerase III delta subunit
MIVLVHGPDAATARAEASTLLSQHDPDGGATTRLDGRTVSIPQLAAMAGTPGFLGQPRVVVVDDLVARMSKAKGNGEADAADVDVPASKLDISSLFDAVLPENLLILVDSSLSSVPAAIRKALPAGARVIAGDPPRGKALLEWMQARAAAMGSQLPPSVATELAEALFPQTWAARPSNPRYDRPPDLALIGNEIDKLSLAAYPGPIARGHVNVMIEATAVDRLFPFIEAAVGGDIRQATKELGILRDAGEDGHRINAQIFQQIELAAVQEAAGRGTDPVEVGRALGLPNPNRMIGIARARRAHRAAASIQQARQLDRNAKTGQLRDPMDVLYGIVAGSANSAEAAKVRRSG